MNPADNPKLYKIRHSLAHVLAQAVQEKYPNAKLGFGPPTDTGFFYDFDFGSEHVTPEVLPDLEKRMRKIIAANQEFKRTDLDYDSAVQKLKGLKTDESYKVENVQNLKAKGETNFSFYENGEFVDLCEGPHVATTRELPPDAFKLDRLAGAYWLGSEKNKMLTRIYALAFENKQKLDEFIKRRQMAEEFDHKKLGAELDIYHQEEIVGKGLILWLPNGTVIRDEIEKYAKEREFAYNYKRVATPHITKADLYHRSQHLPAYKESMYPPMIFEDEGKKTEYYLKPMNCPHHHLIYASRMRSYRDLPLRLAEYGTQYRFEQSGELSGLIRVRCMTLNDAHIYLRPDQFEEEFRSIISLYNEFYSTFKLKDYKFRLSTKGTSDKDKFKGDASMWQEGETLLKRVLDDMKVDYYIGEGEAAFYGPKVDIQFKTLQGREETVSTIQVDYLGPKNFNLKYIDSQGHEQAPLIIHRAPLSTHERFISFLMEYYGGAFPTWCAPIQVAIIPVNVECLAYAKQFAEELHGNFIRVEVDESDNSFNKKIRTHTVRKIPIMLIVGNKEVQEGKVTVRRYGEKEQSILSKSEFLMNLREEIDKRLMLREPMSSIV